MCDKCLVSIIIPVYNAKTFISRVVESCISQSFKNFELILVNDGSKDNSLQIIRNYAQNDQRVRLVNIPNSGVVKAREYGVSVAEGEFLLFMDADDQLPTGALQVLVNAITPDADMVIGDINQVEVDGSSALIKYGNLGCVSGKEHFDWIVREHVGFLWGKLIRKSLVDNIKVMPYGVKFCEDYLQMLQMSYNARKVVHIDSVTYNYVQQDESACNKALPVMEYAQRFADLCINIKDIIEKCGFDTKSEVQLKVLFLYYCRLYLLSNGAWKPNLSLRESFNHYIGDRLVKSYYVKNDFRRYRMTIIVRFLYPFFSILYKKQLEKWGRIK